MLYPDFQGFDMRSCRTCTINGSSLDSEAAIICGQLGCMFWCFGFGSVDFFGLRLVFRLGGVDESGLEGSELFVDSEPRHAMKGLKWGNTVKAQCARGEPQVRRVVLVGASKKE